MTFSKDLKKAIRVHYDKDGCLCDELAPYRVFDATQYDNTDVVYMMGKSED